MLFNSIGFLIFFPLVTAGYFVLPHGARWAWLLLASCTFYMAFVPAYILILMVMIAVDYAAGIGIERSTGAARKTWLVGSLVANIGFLSIFKYGNFLIDNLNLAMGLTGANYQAPHLGIVLPIGLSFHTFQSMSYTIEVYRGHQKAERNLGIFALYVMFYPQLVAGPIERPQNLLHQFYERHRPDYQRIRSGLLLMLWGFFQKMVVADRAAGFVNTVFDHPQNFTGVPLLLGMYLFSIQIFCDFAGYSNIAIGAARVMGFDLMRNFRSPYFASSIPEFWRRWHISLSTWFRDYVFFSLGGSRVSRLRWIFNIFVVFLLSGLWHGAAWTFVLWGALHAIFYVASKQAPDPTPVIRPPLVARLRTMLNVFVTFNLVSFAWVFFRARSFSDAVYVLSHAFVGLQAKASYGVGLGKFQAVLLAAAVIAMESVHFLEGRGLVRKFYASPTWMRWTVYYGLAMVILIFGKFSGEQFIYFQF